MALFHARGNPVCRKEDCSPYDIGTVYKEIARFSNEKFRFIQNVWKPDRLFNFPSTLKSGDRHPESLNQTDSHAFLGFFTQSTWMVLFVYPVFVLGWGLARTVPSSISCFDLRSHSGRLLAPSFNSIRLGSWKYTA